jgi:hypothetical protein
MTAAARDVLAAFEMLSPTEKHKVAAEILRRSTPDGDLPEVALAELADEMFRSYDAEESARAES